MKNGIEESFDVKYERPPLFCYLCGKIGHGTKDCDSDGDDKDQEFKFGGWLKASPWKVGRDRDEAKEDVRGESCARDLFITKPKKEQEKAIKERVEEVVDRLSSWKLLKGQEVEGCVVEEERTGEPKQYGEQKKLSCLCACEGGKYYNAMSGGGDD